MQPLQPLQALHQRGRVPENLGLLISGQDQAAQHARSDAHQQRRGAHADLLSRTSASAMQQGQFELIHDPCPLALPSGCPAAPAGPASAAMMAIGLRRGRVGSRPMAAATTCPPHGRHRLGRRARRQCQWLFRRERSEHVGVLVRRARSVIARPRIAAPPGKVPPLAVGESRSGFRSRQSNACTLPIAASGNAVVVTGRS